MDEHHMSRGDFIWLLIALSPILLVMAIAPAVGAVLAGGVILIWGVEAGRRKIEGEPLPWPLRPRASGAAQRASGTGASPPPGLGYGGGGYGGGGYGGGGYGGGGYANPAPVVGTMDWGGVMLEAHASKPQAVLVVMPMDLPDLAERIAAQPFEPGMITVRALVVLNHIEGGTLLASQVAEKFRIPKDAIYATAPERPLDRGAAGDTPKLSGKPATHVQKGQVTLRFVDGTLRVRWGRPGGPEALIGERVRFAQLASGDGPVRTVVGCFEDPSSNLVVDHAVRFLDMSQAVLLAGLPGLSEEVAFQSQLLPAVGLGVTAIGLEPDPARKLGAAIDRIIDAIVDGDLDQARARIAAAREAHGECPDLSFQTGVVAFMSGDLEAARQAYRAAASGMPEAWCNLSATLCEAGELEAATEAAERAVEALPDDPLSLNAAVTANVLRGRIDEARAHVTEFLMRHPGEQLAERLDEALQGEVADDGLALRHRFPLHAERARRYGEAARQYGRNDEALHFFRRAWELSPSSLEAVADLGAMYSDLGDDDKALEVYDEALEAGVLAGDLLRFNRGNALRRLERLHEAEAEYRTLIDLLPEWLDPRINLIATLVQRRDKRAAKRELKALLRQFPDLDRALRSELQASVGSI